MAKPSRSIEELERQVKALEGAGANSAAQGTAQYQAWQRVNKELQRAQSLLEQSLHTTQEMDETLGSIAASWGKNNQLYKQTKKSLEGVNADANILLGITDKLDARNQKNKKHILDAASGYKKVNAEVFRNLSSLAEGQEINGQITEELEEQIAKHKELLTSTDKRTKAGKELKTAIEGEVAAMEKLAKAAKGAQKDIAAIQREGEKFAGTMFGGAIDKTLKAFGKKDGIGGVLKSITSARGTGNKDGGVGGMFTKMLGGVARFLGPIGLAVGGIMAAAEFFDSGGAAKMAMRMAVLQGNDPMNSENVDKAMKQSKGWRDLQVEKYYKTPLKLQQQSESDYLEYKIGVEDDAAKYKESLIRDEIDYRFGLEADAIQFRQQQASQELDAQLSRQKTLFTSGMGYMKQAIGISERALMAIGSSTAAVLDTVKEYGYTLGIALKDQIKLSAAAQGLAVRYGTSATEVFKMADTFRLMNKTSAKTGANLVAGLESLAKKNDMSPAQLYKEMADAQADILKYSSYTTQEYARQAIELGNMNTSMANMLKASDSMVLNYKDSIKAEMSLSAMLGKNVNFSEVRAKLMSGDQAGGAAALKTALGGQDINAMNAFQKQALSQATGMGIQELMQLTQSTGGKAKGTLEERNAAKTGKAIANGALQQDIANAAAKLALDQKNRAEMLKFEQAKRMAMLFVEQKFRLNAIEREITYRKEREEKGQKDAERNYKMSLMGEVASEQIMQLSSAYTDAKNAGKISEAQLSQFKAETMKSQDILQHAMTDGFINDSEIADIALKRFEAAQKGEMFDVTKIAGVQKYLGAYAEAANKQNDVNSKMIAAMENYVKIVNDPNSSMGKVALAKAEAMKYGDVFNKLEDFSDVLSDSIAAQKRKQFIADLKKKTGRISTTPNGAPTIDPVTKKPILISGNTKTKTDTKTTPITLPPNAPTLGDTQAQTKLQSEMVTLLGLSAGFLKQLLEVSAAEFERPINLNGTKLNSTLLAVARKNYAIAGATR